MCIINALQSVLFVILQLKLLLIVNCYTLNTNAHHLYKLQVSEGLQGAHDAGERDNNSSLSIMLSNYQEETRSANLASSPIDINDNSLTSNSANCSESESDQQIDLPIPSDISVMLASWTPPSIRVSWTFPNSSESAPDKSRTSRTSPVFSSEHNLPVKALTSLVNVDEAQRNQLSSLIASRDSTTATLKNPVSESLRSSHHQTDKSHHVASSMDTQRFVTNCTHDTKVRGVDENNINCTSMMMNDVEARGKCNTSQSINSQVKLEAFRIIYHPIKTRYRIIREVPPWTRNVTIDGLEPNVNYELVIIALFESPANASIPPISKPLSALQTSTPSYSKELHKFYQQIKKDTSNGKLNNIQGTNDDSMYKSRESASEAIRFISPDIEPGRFNRHSRKPLILGKRDPNEKVSIKTDEIIIVILVLCIWCGVICLFIKKWGKIRAIEPCQSYFSPEIYDIPLKKSVNGSNGDLSNAPNGIDGSQLCPSATGDGLGTAAYMTSTESRRSLTTSMTIAAAAAATMAANASNAINAAHRRDSYPRFLGSSSPSSLYLTVHRPRINSVFVTPPTRPPTPLPMATLNYSSFANQQQQQQYHAHQQSSSQSCSSAKQAESPVAVDMATSSSSIPRRFKSAEDLRSIVYEFTRRKSTLLMSASYFQQQQQHSKSSHGSSSVHQQQSILERESSIPSTSSSPSYSQHHYLQPQHSISKQ